MSYRITTSSWKWKNLCCQPSFFCQWLAPSTDQKGWYLFWHSQGTFPTSSPPTKWLTTNLVPNKFIDMGYSDHWIVTMHYRIYLYNSMALWPRSDLLTWKDNQEIKSLSPLVLDPAVQGPLQRSPVTNQARRQGIDLTLHRILDLWGPEQTNHSCHIKIQTLDGLKGPGHIYKGY